MGIINKPVVGVRLGERCTPGILKEPSDCLRYVCVHQVLAIRITDNIRRWLGEREVPGERNRQDVRLALHIKQQPVLHPVSKADRVRALQERERHDYPRLDGISRRYRLVIRILGLTLGYEQSPNLQ